jgi:hypothetical protein
MPSALDSYAEYARLIFFLLADRPTIEHHSLAVYTTSRTIGRVCRIMAVAHSLGEAMERALARGR